MKRLTVSRTVKRALRKSRRRQLSGWYLGGSTDTFIDEPKLHGHFWVKNLRPSTMIGDRIRSLIARRSRLAKSRCNVIRTSASAKCEPIKPKTPVTIIFLPFIASVGSYSSQLFKVFKASYGAEKAVIYLTQPPMREEVSNAR